MIQTQSNESVEDEEEDDGKAQEDAELLEQVKNVNNPLQLG